MGPARGKIFKLQQAAGMVRTQDKATQIQNDTLGGRIKDFRVQTRRPPSSPPHREIP